MILQSEIAHHRAHDARSQLVLFLQRGREDAEDIVAVCAAYHVRPGAVPFALSRHIVAGFQSLIPLEPEELDLLPDLILARQVMGLLIFAWRGGLRPDRSASHLRQVGRLARRVERLLHPARPVPPDVLLIDDVITTGATADAAARALHAAGATRVRVLCAARVERTR